MSVKHYPVISDAFGRKLEQPMDFISLEYTRVENEIGKAKLVLPYAPYPESLLAKDYGITFECSIDNKPPYIDTETSWFIRDWRRKKVGKEKTWEIDAYCLNHLWGRRVVDYNESNAYTSKLGELDDMGKAVWRENYGTLATDTTRRTNSYVSVQQDLALAPIARMSFARDKVYDALRAFSAVSWEKGVYLVFDTVLTQTTQPRFQFRAYVGQRGIDRRATGLVFSEDFRNLTDVEVSYTSSDEVTRGIAGGQGVATTQVVARYTSPRSNDSPFNLIEAWENHTDEADAVGLSDAAQGIANKGQPRRALSGTIVDKSGARYGVDWQWGDRVRAIDEGDEFDCRISAVTVRQDRGAGRTVVAQLRGEITDG